MTSQSFLKLTTIKLICLLALTTFADEHSCPDERPYPRGGDACDSCPWEETLAQYQAGELSETRESEVFGHQIRVSIVCDVNRPVDIEDVYTKIGEVERNFDELFGPAIIRKDSIDEDGNPKVLEVVTGICDYEDGVDDCVMYAVCESGPRLGCGVSSGQAFANASDTSTHITFVPYFREGRYWWVRGNRYGNLQHEYAHLLDYTFFRQHSERGNDLNWWREGFPQFAQNQILDDDLSWQRGNDGVHLLEIFTHRYNTSDYYDGMRVMWYLAENAPWQLQNIASEIRSGIYDTPDSHLSWHFLMGFIAARHQDQFDRYLEVRQQRTNASFPIGGRANWPGLVDAEDSPHANN